MVNFIENQAVCHSQNFQVINDKVDDALLQRTLFKLWTFLFTLAPLLQPDSQFVQDFDTAKVNFLLDMLDRDAAMQSLVTTSPVGGYLFKKTQHFCIFLGGFTPYQKTQLLWVFMEYTRIGDYAINGRGSVQG